MFVRLFVAVLLFASLPAYAGESLPPSLQSARLDQAVNDAISRGLIAGAVVLVGNHREVLFQRAYGRSSAVPDARPMAIDDIFDLASLTKVVATTPAILKLAEEGKISLVDPVSRWFPEFSGKGKDDLLVMNLLTHTSGLDDFSLPAVNARQIAIEGASAQRLKGTVGSRFRYADINFILLGEMVKRVTGTSLDQYSAENVFSPLGMKDTAFNPDERQFQRCSATLTSQSRMLVGQVQDDSARYLGGVAGHAGVFSTAQDLARFCQMVLDEGEYAGKRILSKRAVHQMTAPYFSRGGNIVRGLGWDIASPYSAPKGIGFSEVSFGHTGYSGGSIWIDPETDLFVVLLTARLEYRHSHTKDFSQLRRNVSSLSAELFGSFPWLNELALPHHEQL